MINCAHCGKPIDQKKPFVTYNRQVEVMKWRTICVRVIEHDELERLHPSCDKARTIFHREEPGHVGE